MVIRPFNYVAPTSLQEACKFLDEHHDDAKLLAGGQSLIPMLKLNLLEPAYLVDLKRIPNMTFIRTGKDASSERKEAILIGALTTHSEIARSETVAQLIPLLAETAGGIGHPLVRNRGTLGGSLSHCDPAADLCATSLALEATMVIASREGTKRTVPAKDFFKGTFETDLRRGEILEHLSFPIPQSGTGHSFQKLTLGHGDFPLLVVSVLLRVESGKCADVAIALGGVSDRAIRMAGAEEMLRGKDIVQQTVERASEAAMDASHPSSDLEVSADYKKKMVKVFVRRALRQAIDRSSGLA